jgi:hypothetical protein
MTRSGFGPKARALIASHPGSPAPFASPSDARNPDERAGVVRVTVPEPAREGRPSDKPILLGLARTRGPTRRDRSTSKFFGVIRVWRQLTVPPENWGDPPSEQGFDAQAGLALPADAEEERLPAVPRRHSVVGGGDEGDDLAVA